MKRRALCGNGLHKMEGGNLIAKGSDGYVRCRACYNAYKRKRHGFPGAMPQEEKTAAYWAAPLCSRGHPWKIHGRPKTDTGRRYCGECNRLRSAIKDRLRRCVRYGLPFRVYLRSALENFGTDYSDYVKKLKATQKEETQWQHGQRKLKAARALMRRQHLVNGRRQNAWPWPIEESKPARTSPG